MLRNTWPLSFMSRRSGGEPPWSGAPGYIGSGSFFATTGDLSLDIPYPTDIQLNDILILNAVAYESTSGTPNFNTPSGWTLISNGTINFSTLVQGVFWKRADGTESGTQTVTHSTAGGGGDAHSGQISNYRGCVSTGTPYEAMATTNGNNNTPTGSSITTTGNDRKALNIIAKANPAPGNITPAAGWSEQYDNAVTSPKNMGVAIHDKTVATASTEPAEAATSAASGRWRMVSLALLPR